MRDLFVFHDDNSVFADFSSDARDYLRDNFTLTFTAAEDKLYLGLYKPFFNKYPEIISNSASPTLTWKYFNGSIFTAFTPTDDSQNYTRSGFVSWERDLDDWALTTINSEELFWIEITSNIDFVADIQGLNMVFSDDNDLIAEMRNIDEFRFASDPSFIAYHVAARNEIIQTLRNGGHTTQVLNENLKDLTKWDILIPDQIRAASKFLTLSKIMFDVSSNIEDKYYQRFKDYRGMHAESFKLYLQALDTDDDGEVDDFEENNFRSVEFIKV